MNRLIVALALIAGPNDGIKFQLLEADAIIALQEARLKTAKIQVRQDQVVWEYYQEILKRKSTLFRKDAVAEQEYLLVKKDHDLAEIEVEQAIARVEELKREVELAKVKKKIILYGHNE